MVRGMVKKGLIGAGLGAALMFGLFGTRAWHYTRYAAERVRETARANVPFDAEVESAREQVGALKPAIEHGIETLAKLGQSISDVQAQIAGLDDQIAHSAKRVQTLKASVDTGDVQRVSTNGASSAQERRTKAEIIRTLDSIHRAEYIREVKKSELEHRKVQYQKLKDSLHEMKDKREALMSRIKEIEAKHDAMQFTQEFEDINIDTGPLAEAEKAVADLDRRVELDVRKRELNSTFGVDSERATPGYDTLPADRDPIREAEEFLRSRDNGSGNGRVAEKDL